MKKRLFIIVRENAPLVLVNHPFTKKKILLSDRVATSFKTKVAAQKALDQTIAFAAKFGYYWADPKLYSIIPVKV